MSVDNFHVSFFIRRAFVSGGSLVDMIGFSPIFISVSINEKVIYKTKEVFSPFIVNELVECSFPTLEPLSPQTIVFSMYKKKKTAQGHKLIGSLHISLDSLIVFLNKDTLSQRYKLIQNRKHLTLHGEILLDITVQDRQTFLKSWGSEIESNETKETILRRYNNTGVFSDSTAINSFLSFFTVDFSSLKLNLFDFENAFLGQVVGILLIVLLSLFFVWHIAEWYTLVQELRTDSQQSYEASKEFQRAFAATRQF